jgi:tetratricopeptide (TPR) repeat protein
MVGVCLSFPFLVSAVLQQMRSRMKINGSAVVYSSVLITVLTIGTMLRNQVWRDEVRLWSDVVSKSPRSDRGYNSIAFAYLKRSELQLAINTLEEGMRAIPEKRQDFIDTLGNLYLKVGRSDDAIELFKENIGHFTGDRKANAYNNLGVAYLYKWNGLQARRSQMSVQAFEAEKEQILRPAAEAFSKGLEVNRDLTWMLDSYVNILHDLDSDASLESTALDALTLKEDSGGVFNDFNSFYTLGKIAFLRNDFAKADQYFEQAEKVRNDLKLLYFNHGYALDQLKKKDQAIAKYLMAVRLDPIFIEAHHNVAQIYMERNDFPNAIDHFREVLRYDPKHVSTNLNLAKIYAIQGNMQRARSYLQTVFEISPGNPQAIQISQQFGL